MFVALNLSTIVLIYRAGFGGHDLLLTVAQVDLFWKVRIWHRQAVIPADQYQTAPSLIQYLYLLTMLSVKLSILFLYLRLFGVSNRFRLVVYGAIGLIIIWYIGLIIVSVISSSATNFIIEPKQSAYVSGISNLLTDVIVLFLPMRMVWRLKVSWQTKVKLIGLFLLGLL